MRLDKSVGGTASGIATSSILSIIDTVVFVELIMLASEIFTMGSMSGIGCTIPDEFSVPLLSGAAAITDI